MDDVQRPRPAATPGDRAREWLEWFGVARLVTSAIAVVVVCLGAWWLVRTPAPPSDALLPLASGSTVPAATLPAPPGASGPGVDQGGGRVDGSSVGAGGGSPVGSDAGGDDGSGGSPPAEEAESSGGPAGEAGTVVVHVAGAVRSPGVHRLQVGSRVDDAIRLAGGPSDDAQADALNLAAVVTDGARIYVPRVGEEFVEPVVTSAAPSLTGSSSDGAPTGPIDVNRATTAELETLPGVGPATAAAIVTERERNGPFAGVADLERVPGIGPAKLAALEGLVTT